MDIAELKLSTLVAMLGSVTANLAALTVGENGAEIRVAATFFNDPSEEDREEVECIATEIIAMCPDHYTVVTEFHTLSEGRPKMLTFWAFVRSGVDVL